MFSITNRGRSEIEAAVRYHLTHIRVAPVRKAQKVTGAGEDVEKLEVYIPLLGL